MARSVAISCAFQSDIGSASPVQIVRCTCNYPTGREIAPSAIELEEESILQPDVFVFPRIDADIERPSWREIGSLYLAVEVLSPSSKRADRVVKRDKYMRMAVDEYWVVDPGGRHIERWFRDRPDVEVARESLVWQVRGASTTLSIDLPKLFADAGLPRRL